MARHILKTGKRSRPKTAIKGKRSRPKTAIKGKRYRCARCHKRSPKPVKTPAPWYCPKCLAEQDSPPAE
jgi:late competence protein required for DNA uptake (superfamily II DNA/RNA helicase)